MATKTFFPGFDENGMLNNLELTSLKALLAYTAYDKNVTEEKVFRVFSSRFQVNDLEKLPRNSFNDAIRFLVDLQSTVLH